MLDRPADNKNSGLFVELQIDSNQTIDICISNNFSHVGGKGQLPVRISYVYQQRQVNGRKVVEKFVGNVEEISTKIRPHKFSKYQNPVQGVYIRKSKRTMPGGYMREAVRKIYWI